MSCRGEGGQHAGQGPPALQAPALATHQSGALLLVQAWLGFLTFGVVSEQIKTRLEASRRLAGAHQLTGHIRSRPPATGCCAAAALPPRR